MNIDMRWVQSRENQTILWVFEQRWTQVDYYSAVAKSRRMIAEQAPQTINLLLDMRETHTVPTGVIAALIQCHHAGWLAPNYGQSVIVSERPIVQHIYAMMETIDDMTDRIHLVGQMAQAYTLLGISAH